MILCENFDKVFSFVIFFKEVDFIREIFDFSTLASSLATGRWERGERGAGMASPLSGSEQSSTPCQPYQQS